MFSLLMSDETREEIVSELRAYKVANPNWLRDVEMAKVVASYNIRLASMSPAVQPGKLSHPVNLIVLFPSHILHICILYACDEYYLMTYFNVCHLIYFKAQERGKSFSMISASTLLEDFFFLVFSSASQHLHLLLSYPKQKSS